jgi:hypothetical protein
MNADSFLERFYFKVVGKASQPDKVDGEGEEIIS